MTVSGIEISTLKVTETEYQNDSGADPAIFKSFFGGERAIVKVSPCPLD